MKTICICSSIKNLDIIKSSIKGMESNGIKGLFPNIDFQPEGPELSTNDMKSL